MLRQRPSVAAIAPAAGPFHARESRCAPSPNLPRSWRELPRHAALAGPRAARWHSLAGLTASCDRSARAIAQLVRAGVILVNATIANTRQTSDKISLDQSALQQKTQEGAQCCDCQFSTAATDTSGFT